MKEMVLYRLRGKVAYVALVDYAAYTASVKQIPVADDSLETGDLSELVKEGKIRLYGKKLICVLQEVLGWLSTL